MQNNEESELNDAEKRALKHCLLKTNESADDSSSDDDDDTPPATKRFKSFMKSIVDKSKRQTSKQPSDASGSVYDPAVKSCILGSVQRVLRACGARVIVSSLREDRPCRLSSLS